MEDIEFYSVINANTAGIYLYHEQEEYPSKINNKTLHQRNMTLKMVRSILQSTSLEIDHGPDGEPFVKHSENVTISISHSLNWYAVQLSKQSADVGVDIQVFKEGIGNGLDYFVNEQEKRLFELNDLNLHIIWSAKEAVYKCLKGQVANYKSDLSVVSITEDVVHVHFANSRDIVCKWKKINNVMLVYTV